MITSCHLMYATSDRKIMLLCTYQGFQNVVEFRNLGLLSRAGSRDRQVSQQWLESLAVVFQDHGTLCRWYSLRILVWSALSGRKIIGVCLSNEENNRPSTPQ